MTEQSSGDRMRLYVSPRTHTDISPEVHERLKNLGIKVEGASFHPSLDGNEATIELGSSDDDKMAAVRERYRELEGYTDAEKQLLDVATLDDGALQRAEGAFEMVLANLIAKQPDERRRAIFQNAAVLMRYDLFEEPRRPLPEGLICQYDSFGSKRIRDDCWNQADVEYYGEARIIIDWTADMLSPYPMTKVWSDHDSARYAVAHGEHIRDLPVYGLLKSMLDSDEQEEKPLTPYWRLVREQHIEYDVRRKYGLSDTEHIERSSAAARELARGIYRLDDEAIPLADTTKTDACTERIMQWILAGVNDYIQRSNYEFWDYGAAKPKNGTSRELVELRKDKGVLSDGSMFWVEDLIYAWSRDISSKLHAENGLDTVESDKHLLANFYKRLKDNTHRGNSQKLSELLEEAVDETASHVTMSMTMGDIREKLRRPIVDKIYDNVQPQAARHGEIGLMKLTTEAPMRPQVLSRQQYDRFHLSTIGSVERGIEYAANRMLSFGRAQPPLERYVEHPDVTLDIPHLLDSGEGYPSLAGFRLVGVDGRSRFHFIADGHDPYGGADKILVDRGQLHVLTHWFRTIGLNTLADALRSSPDVSVHDLAQLISQSSDYTFDERYDLRYIDGGDFRSYETIVKEDRLQVQCTGAAVFLADSLEIALPGAGVSTINGRLIDSNGLIHLTGHTQTSLWYDGKYHLLDATPSYGSDERSRPLLSTAELTAAHGPLSPKKSSTDNVPAPEYRGVDAIEQQRRELLQDNAKQRIETILRAALGHTENESLYTHLANSHVDDPLRRVIEFAHGDLGDEGQALSIISYLRNYQEAPTELRKSIGVRDYEPATIQSLIKICESTL